MAVAHWFESFRRWRWAPFVALVAGALAFIAIALLLIPIRLEDRAHVVTVQAPPALVAVTQRDFAVARPAPPRPPAPLVAPFAVESPSAASGNSGPSALLVALPVPAATEEAPVSAVNPPDFGANIADRGDRPSAPAPKPRVH